MGTSCITISSGIISIVIEGIVTVCGLSSKLQIQTLRSAGEAGVWRADSFVVIIVLPSGFFGYVSGGPGIGECAQGVGCMGADVMEGFVPGDAVLAWRGHFVVGQRVYPGNVAFFHVGEGCFLRTAGMNDGVVQQGARSVDGGPYVRGALDEDGRVARLFEFFIVFDAVVVTVDAVVREDDVFDTAKEGVPFTEFRDVVVKGGGRWRCSCPGRRRVRPGGAGSTRWT